jgi:hypothetical protein
MVGAEFMKETTVFSGQCKAKSLSMIAVRFRKISRLFGQTGILLSLLLLGTLPAWAQYGPYSIWSDSATPSTLSANVGAPVEFGLMFKSYEDGYITGIRFFKGTGDLGSHVGSLWQLDGTLLGSVSFASETASGWQEQALTQPVAIKANTPYVVSYLSPSGVYASSSGYFASANGVDSPPLPALPLLRALGDGEPLPDATIAHNGLYTFATGSVPNLSSGSANVWVDVVAVGYFDPDTTPPTVTAVSPANGATGVSPKPRVTVTFSEPIDASTIDNTTITLSDNLGNPVSTSVSYDDVRLTATLTPISSLTQKTTYTMTVASTNAKQIKDLAGNPQASPYSSSFTTLNDTTAPTVTVVSPADGTTGVSLLPQVTVTFSESMDVSKINNATITLSDSAGKPMSAAVSYDAASLTATLTPSSPLAITTSYKVMVGTSVTDLAGNPLGSAYSASFTTTDKYRIWLGEPTPTHITAGNNGPFELAVKFQSDVPGVVTGVRFYKGPYNTGTHFGNLWTEAGVTLANAQFVGETALGWQEVSLAPPGVAITAGTTYIVSYSCPDGFFSYDYQSEPGSLFVQRGDGPLHALADSAASPNAVYANSINTFPAVPDSTANFWVDVVMQTVVDNTPPAAPTEVAMAAASDTGTPGDNITYITTPSFTGKAEAGSTVTIFDGSTNIGTGSAATFGSPGITVSTLSPGPHSITAKATDAAGNTSAASSALSVTIDTTAPSPTSVIGPTAGSYRAGQNLDFMVNYSENVTVNTTGGTPYIGLTIGSTAINAVYFSGSGSALLTFRYTVQAGDTDTDGIASASAIALNGGTIAAAAGNSAGLSFTRPNTTAVLVDTTAPTAAISYSPVQTAYKSGTKVTITATLSEAIASSPVMKIATSGANTLTATAMSRTDSTHYYYVFTVGSGNGFAKVSLSVGTDIAGNVVNATPSSGPSFTVDNTPPTIKPPPNVVLVGATWNIVPDNTGWASATDINGINAISYSDSVSGVSPQVVQRTWTATDLAGNKANYVQTITCLPPSLVTDDKGCMFDFDTTSATPDFRLAFSQHPKKSSKYMLSSTTPKHFSYNVFYNGTPNDTVVFNVMLPYPFVTEGANPIQAYDWVTVSGKRGQQRLKPGNLFYLSPMQIRLGVYGTRPTIGSVTPPIPLTLTVPPSGVVYLSIDLDYGLENTSGYTAGANSAAIGSTTTIANHGIYSFSVYVNNSHISPVPITNDNSFN